ncbi:MAG TPA: hypothetical protein VGY66_28825 [Gemmataceae bacterium]|nr:hypothetical protein [Gemmataceae bacterium]
MPSILTVTNNLDSGPGSLRADIAAAQSGDTINFAPSLSGQTIQLTSGELDITKNLTVTGPGAGQMTISGGNQSRVFADSLAKVALSGLTITRGNGQGDAWGGGANGEGGAVFNDKGTLNMVNIILSGNSALGSDWTGKGGAVFNYNGTMTMSGCTLSNNISNQGGAMWTYDYVPSNNIPFGTVTVTGCTLSGNFANAGYEGGAYGDAIRNNGSYRGLRVSNSIFSNGVNAYGGKNYVSGQYTGIGDIFITFSNITFNSQTNQFSESVTLTPRGTSTGPMSLELTNLPSGVTLTNATGTTDGNPYIRFLNSGNTLNSGANVNLTLTFTAASLNDIAFGTQVVAL